jgi:hypothetical protein
MFNECAHSFLIIFNTQFIYSSTTRQTIQNHTFQTPTYMLYVAFDDGSWFHNMINCMRLKSVKWLFFHFLNSANLFSSSNEWSAEVSILMIHQLVSFISPSHFSFSFSAEKYYLTLCDAHVDHALFVNYFVILLSVFQKNLTNLMVQQFFINFLYFITADNINAEYFIFHRHLPNRFKHKKRHRGV